MLVERIAALLMLSGLSVLPMPALAHESDGAAKPTPSLDFSQSERTAIFQEIRVFANARISVRDAIKIAEGRVSGAKVVDVSFHGGGDRPAYNVKTYLKEEISAVTIDASTGKAIGEALVTPVSALDAKDRIELAGFNTAVIDLSDVVPIAEAYGSGKAVSVGLDEENGKVIFLVVVVVADGSLKQISVDPNEQSGLRNASFRKKH
jgi:uncharacterized membrane protein YkoI